MHGEEAPTPQDATALEAQQAVIGKIILDKQDVFDLSNPEENKWLYRLANKWHIITRDNVIANQLLLEPGDLYSKRLSDESERVLRRNQYFYDASIKPVNAADGKVDLLVKTKDVNGIEEFLAPVLRRYPTQEEARNTRAYNRRKMDPYPKDYDETLAEYSVWRVEQHNLVIEAKLDKALDATHRIVERISTDPNYLASFARGVEAGRSIDATGCSQLLALKLGSSKAYSSTTHSGQSPAQTQANRGFTDGKTLVFGLEILSRLPRCFEPLPEASAELRD